MRPHHCKHWIVIQRRCVVSNGMFSDLIKTVLPSNAQYFNRSQLSQLIYIPLKKNYNQQLAFIQFNTKTSYCSSLLLYFLSYSTVPSLTLIFSFLFFNLYEHQRRIYIFVFFFKYLKLLFYFPTSYGSNLHALSVQVFVNFEVMK